MMTDLPLQENSVPSTESATYKKAIKVADAALFAKECGCQCPPSAAWAKAHASAVPRVAVAQRGFSILELLVVIGIIAILSTAVGLSMRDSSGQALRSATNIISAQIQSARTAAVLGNTEVRLLIENSTDEENGFRRMRLVREEEPDSNTWEAIGPPVRLPKGVFIDFGTAPPHTTLNDTTTLPLTMTFDGKDYYYYEFSSTGTLDRNAGARIVVAAGRHSAEDGWERKNDVLLQGIFLRRLGDSSVFEDVDHLNASFSN